MYIDNVCVCVCLPFGRQRGKYVKNHIIVRVYTNTKKQQKKLNK